MPLSGTLNVAPRVETAPLVTALADEAIELPKADVLYVMFEIDAAEMEDMIPPSLHPTIPPTLTIFAVRAPDSTLGPFTFAQARIGCRAGVRPRGYVTGGYIDDAAPVPALADRWGFSLEAADVVVERRYHDVVCEVTAGGRTILSTSLVDPVPLSGAEIQFAPNMHLARVRRDGQDLPRLVQMDPEFTFHRAARGTARLDAFDPQAWGDDRVTVVYPVSAWHAVCDVTLPKIRYVCDPVVPALQGTEKVD